MLIIMVFPGLFWSHWSFRGYFGRFRSFECILVIMVFLGLIWYIRVFKVILVILGVRCYFGVFRVIFVILEFSRLF
jgi:hypothetical protein